MTETEVSFLFAMEAIDYENIILGMLWMQDKKITYDIEHQTVSVYHHYNCSYTPIPSDNIFTTISTSIENLPPFILILVCIIIGLLLMFLSIKLSNFLSRTRYISNYTGLLF